jgi:hypothetical protein
VVRMRRSLVAVTVLVLPLASSATSLATSGYRLHVAAWSRPPSGSLFSVNAHGVAAQKALLYVYVDREPCRSTQASEADRLNITTFRAGQSHFRGTGRGVITLWVSGHFNKSFTAQAGTTAQREYACAYLTTPNSQGDYQITAAHRSSAYTVTN